MGQQLDDGRRGDAPAHARRAGDRLPARAQRRPDRGRPRRPRRRRGAARDARRRRRRRARRDDAGARGRPRRCERGIVVDDALRTSAPSVWAVGECAEHRGVVYGLWAPLAEQARVAGAGVAGDPAAFHGAVPATTLKVSGVDVYAGGASGAEAPAGHDVIVLSDTRRGIFRRLVLDGERLTGAALVGDVAAARRLTELLRSGEPVPLGSARVARRTERRRARRGPGGDALLVQRRHRRRGAERDPPRRAAHGRAGRAADAGDDRLRRVHERRRDRAQARGGRDPRLTASPRSARSALAYWMKTGVPTLTWP